MAKNAISILQDEATLERFKENAQQHTKRFSLESILPVYEKIYKPLCPSDISPKGKV